jgi:hypothetical protein
MNFKCFTVLSLSLGILWVVVIVFVSFEYASPSVKSPVTVVPNR